MLADCKTDVANSIEGVGHGAGGESVFVFSDRLEMDRPLGRAPF